LIYLARIQKIKEIEDEIQTVLVEIESGQIDDEKIEKIVGKEELTHISKRKQRIMEERQGMGVDPRSGEVVGDPLGLKLDTYHVKQYGPDSRRITTGHHAKGISGNLGGGSGYEKDLERKFYSATQDTHGGKAHYGKRGSSYTNSEGKRVRKR
jgi:hypothetical protein